MADEGIVTFNEDARRRIRQSVGVTEGGDTKGRGPPGPTVPRFTTEIKLGKADAAIAKGASGTISEYHGTTAGSETDTTVNFSCYNRFGDIASGKWVIFFWFKGHWEILQAEC